MPYEKIGKEVRCIADEIPFEIPDSWEWVRLRTIVYNHGQKTPQSDFCYIDIGSIDNQNQCLNSQENIVSAHKAPSRARRIVEYGDILYSTVRPYLHNMCIVNRTFSKDVIASTGFAVLTCFDGVDNNFLFRYMMSPFFDSYANSTDISKGIAYPAINDEKLYNAFIPLPPLAEQKNIVAKIEELLPHIEEYGKAESKVSKLNAEFPERLKKSILQWAIQGKLVPQNPDDEPASVLLERIRAEKAKLIKEGKIKKDKNESIIFRRDNSHYTMQGKKEVCIDEKLPFDLPDRWEWCNLQMVTENIHYGYTASAAVAGNSKLLRITDIQNNAVSWEDVPFCTVTPNELEGYQLHNRDIMIARTGGTIGKTYIVRNLDETAVFASYLIRAIPVSQINEEYLKIFMESPFYWKQLKDFSSGTGQPNVNGNSLKNLLLPLPPLEEQKRIVDFYFDFLPTIETLTDFSL